MSKIKEMDLSGIARLADGLKTKKAQSYQIVLDVINGGGQIDALQLAALYNYFLPKLPARPKTAEQWVAMALGNDPRRPQLDYIYSDGKRISATDGHRLHIYTTAKYAPGFYNLAMVKIHDAKWLTYPDIDRVISTYTQTLIVSELKKGSINIGSRPCPHYILPGKDSMGRTWGINSQYLDAALSFFNARLHTTNTIGDSVADNIMLESGDCQAIIMPMRVSE